LLKLKRLEISTGHRLLQPGSRAPRFATFAADYLAWSAAEHPASAAHIASLVTLHLIPDFGSEHLDTIRPKMVEDYKQRRAREAKAATVGKEIRTLKAMLNRAVAWELLARNPIAQVSEPKLLDSKPPRYLTIDELAALYGAAGDVHRAIWRLYANTGMRRMEGIHLRREHIGSDALRILSTAEARTKSARWREIPISIGARQALDDLPKITGGWVLPRMHPASLSRECIRDARAAGLRGVGLHTLRHTYISHLVMGGAPLRAVQVLAGHSTVRVTEGYSHLAPEWMAGIGRSLAL